MTPLEASALREIGKQHPSERAALEAQLVSATVERRKNTGHGFFTYLRVDRGGPPIEARSPIGNVVVTITGFQDPVGLTLFLKDGYVDCLEGYVYGEGDTAGLDWSTVDFAIVTSADR